MHCSRRMFGARFSTERTFSILRACCGSRAMHRRREMASNSTELTAKYICWRIHPDPLGYAQRTQHCLSCYSARPTFPCIQKFAKSVRNYLHVDCTAIEMHFASWAQNLNWDLLARANKTGLHRRAFMCLKFTITWYCIRTAIGAELVFCGISTFISFYGDERVFAVINGCEML